jgi:two-component system cell cycle response regulator
LVHALPVDMRRECPRWGRRLGEDVSVPTALDLEDQVLHASVLPSLPQVAVRIIQLSRNPETTVEALGECLSADPALVQKVLRVVNSPFYGLNARVSTVSRAVAYLGIHALRGLVLGFSLARDTSDLAGEGFSMVTFWRYSLTTAVTAKLLARQVGYRDAEEAFIGGLLADIGILALHRAAPPAYAEVLARRRAVVRSAPVRASQEAPYGVTTSDADLLSAIEREVLGTDHARVGGRLCAHWGLPEVLSIPIACHHAPASAVPEGAGEDHAPVADLARLVHLASFAGQSFNLAGKGASLVVMERLAREYFHLRPAVLEGLLQEVAASVQQTAEVFEVEVGRVPRYDEILQQASEELSVLRASAGLAEQERQSAPKPPPTQAAEVGESTAPDVATAVESEDREAADGVLTRAGFERVLAQTFTQGRAAGAPMGLVLVDVRRLKAPAASPENARNDAVLAELARRLRAATRQTDQVARYRGDDFVVVLPEADLAAVQHVAARLRAAVRDHPYAALTGRSLDVAVNLGALAVSDYARARDPATLLAAADKLLHASKSAPDRHIRCVCI